MKKVLWLIVCLMTMVFTSCGSTYSVSANYDVCYPDGTKNYTFENTYTKSSEPTISCYSIGGTNYISIHSAIDDFNKNPKGRVIISTTAPIRLNESKVEELKRGRKIDKNDDIYIHGKVKH